MTHSVSPLKSRLCSWRWLLAIQENPREAGSYSVVKSQGDPKATVVVSRWHSDRSRGYKQLVTGVRSKLFHFQTSRHRSRPLTVRETGALWQALAYPKERSSVPYSGRVWEGGRPSLGLEHRCALLAETRVWEGTGMGRLGSASSHRLWLAMAWDKCWKESPPHPWKYVLKGWHLLLVYMKEKEQILGDRYHWIVRGPERGEDFTHFNILVSLSSLTICLYAAGCKEWRWWPGVQHVEDSHCCVFW